MHQRIATINATMDKEMEDDSRKEVEVDTAVTEAEPDATTTHLPHWQQLPQLVAFHPPRQQEHAIIRPIATSGTTT
jgi:negative regulator of sigma E activity